MELKGDLELANTRAKLEQLEALYEADKADIPSANDDEELHKISMQSVKRLINQLKEEIARYEARQPARR